MRNVSELNISGKKATAEQLIGYPQSRDSSVRAGRRSRGVYRFDARFYVELRPIQELYMFLCSVGEKKRHLVGFSLHVMLLVIILIFGPKVKIG